MNEPQNNLNQLLARLESLMEKQWHLQQEMHQLKVEIQSQKNDSSSGIPDIPASKFPDEDKELKEEGINEAEKIKGSGINRKVPYDDVVPDENYHDILHTEGTAPLAGSTKSYEKSNLEKFIGENLINKIGIAITVIGVGIGAKYSIENELINPLTRIIFGYFLGLGFIGFAIWLKAKYDNFSAVLLSGGMATMYLITYAAYSFYGLFPQVFTFVLMVLFTVFTVVAAIHYNRQVIAHIGLVGAYAVPFLLSDGSGNVAVLFTYISIINLGILVIAVNRYWKSLYYAAFSFTWIIFMAWFFSRYEIQEHFNLSLFFLSIFFIIFYGKFLVYKVIRKERFVRGDVILLLLNSFIFYGLGYAILTDHQPGEQYLGLFTLLNALVHFGISAIIFKKKLADKNLFYLLAGLVLVFITISVPVQLDGNWVTLLWAGQALLLFWIGRKNEVPFYETLSYPLIILSFISLLHDWSSYDSYSYNFSHSEAKLKVVFNVQFLSNLIFIGVFSLMLYVKAKKGYNSHLQLREALLPVFNLIIPAIIIIVAYFSFRIEIERYWDQIFLDSAVEGFMDSPHRSSYTNYDQNLLSLKKIWVINYSLLFLMLLNWAQILKIKNNNLALVIYSLNIVVIAVFLGLGLYLFSELRDSYSNQNLAEYYNRDSAYLPLRYISFIFFTGLLLSFYKMVQQFEVKNHLRKFFDYILHISILWILSSELINWLELTGSSQSYKLGLSILFGVYALFLIALGIWKKKKHLRIVAIVLFAVTLLKLFFYDIANMDTISKTVIFLFLGILLLIISFLYNKYKLFISDEV